MTCIFCKKEFPALSKKAKYCSFNCKRRYRSFQMFPDSSEYVECKICGFRGKQILQHIVKVHKISINDYCKKFNCARYDLSTRSFHNQMSNSIKKANALGKCGWQKDGKNPSKSNAAKSGRYSVYSMNFKGYDGLSDDEKRAKIAKLTIKVNKIKDKQCSNTTSLKYYLKRGYSEEEAKKLLKERQSTFSKKKCIEKYGKDKGLKIFNERQVQWQNTLKSLPPDEIERINKAKAAASKHLKSFSKISQDLFKVIHDKVKHYFSEIFYATHNIHNENTAKNYEYEVILADGIHRYFLDFYVKDNNKVIEFDGDYWHGEARGNKLYDEKREAKLIELGFKNILHIKECDFRRDPGKTIDKCVKYLLET